MQATDGHPARSDRYRDIFAPLGLQDELRGVLRIRGVCWGYSACTGKRPRRRFPPRRWGSSGGSPRTSPRGSGWACCGRPVSWKAPADGPGLVLLAADGAVAGMNPAAERWLEELGGRPDGSDLPIEIAALATRLRHLKHREPGCPGSGSG